MVTGSAGCSLILLLYRPPRSFDSILSLLFFHFLMARDFGSDLWFSLSKKNELSLEDHVLNLIMSY